MVGPGYGRSLLTSWVTRRGQRERLQPIVRAAAAAVAAANDATMKRSGSAGRLITKYGRLENAQ